MPGIQKMAEAGKIKFSSLHNFCPLPVEVLGASPDCYQFSSAIPNERERAVKQTFQTIDFADVWARLLSFCIWERCGCGHHRFAHRSGQKWKTSFPRVRE